MGTTATWTVYNPAAGTEYIAPAAYWFVPQANTSVTVKIQTFDSNGNLVTVSSMTAIVRDVTTNSDKGSYIGTGGPNTVTTIDTVGNGSDVYAPAGKINSGSPAQLRMYASYTGTAYDQPPNAPSNLSPSGTTTTTSPTYKASFSDPTGGDTLAQLRFQIYNGSNGSGSLVYDSGNLGATSGEASAAQMSRTGPALTYGNAYSWRAVFANQNGNWGAWSGWSNFSSVQGPNTPGSVAPSGVQPTLTPTWSFQYSSPASTGMQSYRYTITAQSGGATVYDSGTVSDAVASGTTVTGTIPSGANLNYGGQYNFNVYATDTNGAVSPTATSAFSVATLPQSAPTSPINNANVNSQTPTLAWSYSDPNYTQAKYQVQVLNKATGATLWDSGQVSSAASSITYGGTAIAWNTQIQWRVQTWDSAGLASGWSTYAYATVLNSPTAAITYPANNGTVPNNQPTVTWTYTPSATSNPQSSATITLMDANSNTLATYTQTGAGTSYTLPAGVLQNTKTYQLTVSVTDTGSLTGTSGVVTFTVSYNPPADMQGQLLANGKNYVVEPYLSQDANRDGIADSWNTFSSGLTPTFGVDQTQVQPGVQLASGDGPVTGAQKIAIPAATGAGQYGRVTQIIQLATAGWTAGSTVLSVAAMVRVQAQAGAPYALVGLIFKDSTGATLSTVNGSVQQTDTSGAFVRLLGPQNVTIPASTASVTLTLALYASATGDTGNVWWCQAQVEAAAASDANFIAGDLGTGYGYDANSFSLRTQLTGNLPTLLANPGQDTDPISAAGGSLTLSWDPTLADSRFTAYLIERRRQDEAAIDSDWVTIATLTNKQQSSFTDMTPGSNVTYQYAIRQQVIFSDGSVGVSAHRAIVVGSVSFSPAWYLTSGNQAGPLYNYRFTTVTTKRKTTWMETAVYTSYLGRVGVARDAGPDAGYQIELESYYNDTWGDNRAAVRRQFVAMQRLNTIWYLKDPEGLVVPVYLSGFQIDEEDTFSDTLATAQFKFMQAQDTLDY